jgi:hypothetical protein
VPKLSIETPLEGAEDKGETNVILLHGLFSVGKFPAPWGDSNINYGYRYSVACGGVIHLANIATLMDIWLSTRWLICILKI